MIIQKVFHTYKDDFPLLLPSQNRMSFNGNALYKLMTNLTLELSDLAAIVPFSYISRHTGDKIPPEHLAPFLSKFSWFVDALGKDQTFKIPTIWFVGHFKDYESAAEAQKRIDTKNIKYFDESNKFNSFEEINDSYWDDKRDAEPFIKFLHQTTMIGIDLLSVPDVKRKLEQLKGLEWMQYASEEAMKPELKEMERYLDEKSPYYNKEIGSDVNKHAGFWKNFTKIKVTSQPDGRVGLGSWPHFLFNTCGVFSSVNNLPLKVET
jgi:hypothetical protein